MLRIARQEIVDEEKRVVAYEILYRDGKHKLGEVHDDHITLDVIVASFLKVGYSKMTKNREKLSFNFSNGDLLKNVSDVVVPQNVIVEILETVKMDSSLIETLIVLKEKGFITALDDFKVDLVKDEELYKYIDIIKVDFLQSNVEERKEVEELKKKFPNIVLLAEKIENEEQYNYALQSGYTLFQGYFISKPEVIDVMA